MTLSDSNELFGLSPESDVWHQPATGSTELSWDPDSALLAVVGGSFLVDQDGTCRVAPSTVRNQLKISASHRFVAIAAEDNTVAIVNPEGDVVDELKGHDICWHPTEDLLLIARAGDLWIWSPDQSLDLAIGDWDAGPLISSWSATGESYVAFGPHSQFAVLGRNGENLAKFPAHDGDPNIHASLGITSLATTGGDAVIAVWDVVGLASRSRIQMNDLAYTVDWDPTQQFVLAQGVVVSVWDVTTGRRIGPVQPAVTAHWHPTKPVLACVDGSSLWLETY